MKRLFIIVCILVAFAAALSLLFVKPDISESQIAAAQKILTPWSIETYDDGTSKVLGIHLDKTTLQESVKLIGDPDSMALFVNNSGPQSIEVYFNKAPTGPLSAKLVVTVNASDAQMRAIMKNSTQHTVLGDGTKKLFLSDVDKQSLFPYVISSITLVPSYNGLDAEYFLERFGEPAAKHQENEAAVSWFYPEKGLTLLIDDNGKEVFQYQAPKNFTQESSL